MELNTNQRNNCSAAPSSPTSHSPSLLPFPASTAATGCDGNLSRTDEDKPKRARRTPLPSDTGQLSAPVASAESRSGERGRCWREGRGEGSGVEEVRPVRCAHEVIHSIYRLMNVLADSCAPTGTTHTHTHTLSLRVDAITHTHTHTYTYWHTHAQHI